ncbi:hypothetical protein FVE85_6689 [Porphyridium purpureum]|uniref:Uncharacterized protein n=1 Tax=Porphyridium purpureum TaxID=35688 RepID=A0A5J4Z7W8_PORPP|nr:hypothetical protein FVE85_6689 [Porphyridium purpureum]|eukprot:POR4811..scf295_1
MAETTASSTAATPVAGVSMLTVRISKSPQLALPALDFVDGLEFAVPAEFTKRSLCELLDELLKQQHQEQHTQQVIDDEVEDTRQHPRVRTDRLDFVVVEKNELLRTSLKNFCETRGLSFEKTVELQCVQAFDAKAKTRRRSKQVPSWMSAMCWSRVRSELVVGVCNGMVVTYSVLGDGQTTENPFPFSSNGEAATGSSPVRDVCWVHTGENIHFAAATEAGSVYIGDTGRKAESSHGTLAVCQTADDASSANALAGDFHDSTSLSTLFVGYESGFVRAFSLSQAALSPISREASGKQRKRKNSDTVELFPQSETKFHSGPVCDLLVPNRQHFLFSASMDGLLHQVDTTAWKTVRTILAGGGKAVTGLTPWGRHDSSAGRFVTSCMDGALRLCDFNASEQSGVTALKAPDCLAQLCLSSSPINEMHVASGGKDGSVRIWDIRSPKVPLHRYTDVHGEEGTVQAVEWISSTDSHGDGSSRLYSCGSNGCLVEFLL